MNYNVYIQQKRVNPDPFSTVEEAEVWIKENLGRPRCEIKSVSRRRKAVNKFEDHFARRIKELHQREKEHKKVIAKR